MILKSRLDALSDGVFAFAMTLLVIDLHLPEDFNPKDATELLHRLGELTHQGVLYIVSFYVLALRWVGMARTAPHSENVDQIYIRWALIHLLLITFVPFTTAVMGRYVLLAPAIWLYAVNTILFCLVALRMIALVQNEFEAGFLMEQRFGLIVLIAASLLTIALSLVAPRWAMFGYLLNAADGPLRWLYRKHQASTPARG